VVAGRLQARRREIEGAIRARVYAVSDPTVVEDSEYLRGLRAAVKAAIDYGLGGLEQGEERSGEIPAPVLAQARTAARGGVGLEIVLRRYAAGYSALSDFLMQEVSGADASISAAELYSLQRELTALFDRLIEAASAEYRRQERESATVLPAQRLANRVRRLLAGDLADTSELGYELDAWHMGAIARGPDGKGLLRQLAERLDRRLLAIEPEEGVTWAWLGSRRELDRESIDAVSGAAWPPELSLALGEPARGPSGWRLTHRQALAAAAVARRKPQPLTRYADVVLLATVLGDEDAVAYLTDTYIAPLLATRDGEALLETLRAYLAACGNVSSAAGTLEVNRKTVNNRIRAIEQRTGRTIPSSRADFEIALKLHELDP
jgi:hypothetical protein